MALKLILHSKSDIVPIGDTNSGLQIVAASDAEDGIETRIEELLLGRDEIVCTEKVQKIESDVGELELPKTLGTDIRLSSLLVGGGILLAGGIFLAVVWKTASEVSETLKGARETLKEVRETLKEARETMKELHGRPLAPISDKSSSCSFHFSVFGKED